MGFRDRDFHILAILDGDHSCKVVFPGIDRIDPHKCCYRHLEPNAMEKAFPPDKGTDLRTSNGKSKCGDSSLRSE